MTQTGTTPQRRAGQRNVIHVAASHVFEVPFPEDGTLGDLRDVMSSIRAHPDHATWVRENGNLIIRYTD